MQSVAVATGAHDLDPIAAGVGQSIAATHAEIDPDYDPGTAAHDAAVLTLATPTAAPPVPIATPEEIRLLGPGTPLTIAGWGLTTTGDSGPTPAQLQTATVELQDARYCESTLGKINVFDPRLWLCTDTPSHVVGTCHGDSGGPLLWTNPAGVVELIGLTDWGFDGCDPPISAFTNLAAVGAWVLVRRRPRRAAAARHRRRPRRHPPKPRHRPHISGTAAPGGTLTCHLGAWTNSPTSFDVDWLYNGKKVTGVHTTRVRLSKTVQRRLDPLRGHGPQRGRPGEVVEQGHPRPPAGADDGQDGVGRAAASPRVPAIARQSTNSAAAHSTTVELAARPAQ